MSLFTKNIIQGELLLEPQRNYNQEGTNKDTKPKGPSLSAATEAMKVGMRVVICALISPLCL